MAHHPTFVPRRDAPPGPASPARDITAETNALWAVATARRPGIRTVLVLGDSPHTPALGRLAESAGATVTELGGELEAVRPSGSFDLVTLLGDGPATLRLGRLRDVLMLLAGQVRPGALLAIEPLCLPGVAVARTAKAELRTGVDGTTVSTVGRGHPSDGGHLLESHQLIADGDGIRHVMDRLQLWPLGPVEYLTALAAAGFSGDFLDHGLAGRPLVLATRR